MYILGYYPAKGALVTTSSQVTFDTSTGLALFKDLQITKSGMYLLSVSVSTTNNEFSSQCFSKPIQIKAATAVIPSFDSGTQPEYIIKFNGSYSSINPAEIKANVYNYISNHGVNIGGMSCYAGSVYVTFYSSDSSSTLVSSLISAGLNISSSLAFVSASINGNTYTCTNCTIVSITSDSSSSNSNSNSNINSNINSNSNSNSNSAISASQVSLIKFALYFIIQTIVFKGCCSYFNWHYNWWCCWWHCSIDRFYIWCTRLF